MKNIKTRNVIKGTIKSLDKAAIAEERMKSAYTKTKERAESAYTADKGSPSEYAAERISRNSEFLAREGGYRFNQIGRKNFKEEKCNFIKAKENIAPGVKTKNTAGVTVKGRKLKEGMFVKGYNHQRFKGSAVLKQNLAKKKAQQMLHTRRTARTGIQTAKTAARTMTRAVRTIVASARALISAIIAGGWIAVIVIIICCLFGAAFYFFGDESSDNYFCLFKRICNSCGVEYNGQHALRHTFATRCIEAGIPPIVLKKWLGHKNIHITLDTYADVFDRMNFDAVDKFDAYIEAFDEKQEEI